MGNAFGTRGLSSVGSTSDASSDDYDRRRRHERRGRRSGAALRRAVFPVEALECRRLLTAIVVTSLADNTAPDGKVTLREAIQAAETNTSVDGSAAGSGADTITFAPALTAGGDAVITLTQFDTGLDSTEFGPTAFILSSDITIAGPTGDNGVIIKRDLLNVNRDAPNHAFRLFDVKPGANLTLENLNLAGGLAMGFSGIGGGAAGMGGAVFNQGTLTVNNSTLTGNTALGGPGDGAAGTSDGSGGGGVGSNADPASQMGGGPNGGTVSRDGGFGGGGGGGAGTEGFTNGGNGGFGGGGGASLATGGFGGFGGGGGGGASEAAGHGGFGGGNGSSLTDDGAFGSGGGAGMGGAIFNESGIVSITPRAAQASGEVPPPAAAAWARHCSRETALFPS
jgi:CSLREA domain-containing protein